MVASYEFFIAGQDIGIFTAAPMVKDGLIDVPGWNADLLTFIDIGDRTLGHSIGHRFLDVLAIAA